MRRTFGGICALLLLLCLAACGKQTGDSPSSAETLSGKVYVPEFAGVEMEASHVEGACVSNGTVWLAGSVSWTVDMDNGSGGTFPMDIAGTALFHGGIEGGTFRQAEGYQPKNFLDGAGGYVYVRDCWPGQEGGVWVVTSVISWGDRPSTDYLQRFDADGKELLCVDTAELPLEQKANWISGTVTDGEGRLYLALEDSVAVFDRDQTLLCTLTAPEWARWDALVPLADGSAALRTSGGMPGDAEVLRVIRPESGDWGESCTLPESCGSIYGGSGEYLFFCDSGDSLYGYNTETGALERLLSWTGVNINSGGVLCLSVLEDGRLAVVTDVGGSTEIAVLTPTDPDTLPEITVLTYATLSLDSETRTRIVEFNKAHTDCRIEARDYSEFGDLTAARTRLHTEILAGNIPDLLDMRTLPARQYGRRGYLEDLLPYLEGDPDLGREAVMERVLDAALQDGKLYQAFSSFSILTAAGRPGLAGKSWTWEDLRTAMAAMPEGGTAFGSYERSGVLELLLPMTVDALADWEAGTVREDAVRSLLEFCNTTPLRPMEETDPYAATLDGTQLLLPIELCSLDWEAVLAPAAFGGACSYVGYPREEVGAGSCFRLMDGAAMTTACKDKEAAWAFLREAFLPRYPTGSYFGGYFPINRADFQRMAEQSTGPLLDETGQPMEGAATAWVIMPDSTLEIPARPLTQEEFDQFMALYQSIDRIYDPDEDLTAIIREEANAYLNGIRPLEDAVRLIKSRAGLYISENQ